jgi:hypothetical protein
LSGPIIAENGVAGKYLVVDYERKQCKVMDTMIIRVCERARGNDGGNGNSGEIDLPDE